VEFLGRVVGPRGIYIGPGYITDIKNWPRPKNKKEVERFLGFTNCQVNHKKTEVLQASNSK
jgi:hypothetical protein